MVFGWGSTALSAEEQSLREEAVEQLRTHRNIRQDTPGTGAADGTLMFSLTFQAQRSFFTLEITLPVDFPKKAPLFQVVGTMYHPWLDAQKMVTGHPKLKHWQKGFNVLQIANEICATLMQSASVPISAAPAPSTTPVPLAANPAANANATATSGVAAATAALPSYAQLQAQRAAAGHAGTHGSQSAAAGQAALPSYAQLQSQNAPAVATSTPGTAAAVGVMSAQPAVAQSTRDLAQQRYYPGSQYQLQHTQSQQQIWTQQAQHAQRMAQARATHATPNPMAGAVVVGAAGAAAAVTAGMGASAVGGGGGGGGTRPPMQRQVSENVFHTPIPPIPNKFPELEGLSVAELRRLRDDPDALQELMESMGSVQEMRNIRNDLVLGNAETARENLSHREDIERIQAEISALQSTLRSLRTEYDEEVSTVRGALGYSITDQTTRERLQEVVAVVSSACEEADRYCEELSTAFLAGNVAAADFVQRYLDLRRHYYLLDVKSNCTQKGRVVV